MECHGDGVAKHNNCDEKHDLQSLLPSPERDFLIRNNGDPVKVASLKGKKVGLYFSASWCGPCRRFTPNLAEVYNELAPNGDFEIVFISCDEDDQSFAQYFSKMPWLAIPFSDSDKRDCFNELFGVMGIPALVIIAPDGKTLHPDVVEIIEEHGSEAYPFTPARLAELEEIAKAKRELQTLESILVSGAHNFVIGRDGLKVPISDLVGKNILLYFSAHWCPPCRAFLPKLVKAYHQIKAKDNAFEVIFISDDQDQASFEEFFANMPWLALPFGDERQASLKRTFGVRGIPTVVALGPTGKTVTTEARELIMYHGADAYPFTEERLKEIEAQHEEMAKGWPQKVNHSRHEHELVLTRYEEYLCDGCDEAGKVWSFHCEECEFDLHPKCAMEEDVGSKGGAEEDVKGGKKPGEGWVCDGDVCFKA